MREVMFFYEILLRRIVVDLVLLVEIILLIALRTQANRIVGKGCAGTAEAGL